MTERTVSALFELSESTIARLHAFVEATGIDQDCVVENALILYLQWQHESGRLAREAMEGRKYE